MWKMDTRCTFGAFWSEKSAKLVHFFASSCTCVFGPQRADKALDVCFGYSKSILQKLLMSTAAELWFDAAAIVDGAVIVGTGSLVHMLVNVHQTPLGTAGTNDCPQWQQWFLIVLLVPLIASVALFSARAHLGASAGGYAYKPPLDVVDGGGQTHYVLKYQRYVLLEFVGGILSICAGAVMQVDRELACSFVPCGSTMERNA